MTTRTRLLPALLLALAGCSVLSSPSDLAPKSDAECAASGQKACGYKCVAVDDPATGCRQPGCSPCPAHGPNTVAVCNAGQCGFTCASPDQKLCADMCASPDNPATGCGNAGCLPCPALGPNAIPACTPQHQCGYLCATGWADCNGDPYLDGCEARLDVDAQNCGVCKRSCGAAPCAGGSCSAEVLDTSSVGEPRGIATDAATTVYWVVAGSGGQAFRWGPEAVGLPFAFPSASLLAMSLDANNTNAVFRLARESASGALHASGAYGPSNDLAIFKIDPTAVGTAPAPTFTRPSSAGHTVLGLAPGGGYVFFSTNADRGVHWITGPSSEGAVTTPAAVNGLASTGGSVLYGLDPRVVGAQGGIWSLGPPGFVAQTYLPISASWPSRIALFPDATAATHVFWADESTGAVYARTATALYTVDPGDLAPAAMDIAADPWGAVWSTSRGKVKAWRALDGAVIDLPVRGGVPNGVALSSTHVYWTEGATGLGTANAVLRVPK